MSLFHSSLKLVRTLRAKIQAFTQNFQSGKERKTIKWNEVQKVDESRKWVLFEDNALDDQS